MNVALFQTAIMGGALAVSLGGCSSFQLSPAQRNPASSSTPFSLLERIDLKGRVENAPVRLADGTVIVQTFSDRDFSSTTLLAFYPDGSQRAEKSFEAGTAFAPSAENQIVLEAKGQLLTLDSGLNILERRDLPLSDPENAPSPRSQVSATPETFVIRNAATVFLVPREGPARMLSLPRPDDGKWGTEFPALALHDGKLVLGNSECVFYLVDPAQGSFLRLPVEKELLSNCLRPQIFHDAAQGDRVVVSTTGRPGSRGTLFLFDSQARELRRFPVDAPKSIRVRAAEPGRLPSLIVDGLFAFTSYGETGKMNFQVPYGPSNQNERNNELFELPGGRTALLDSGALLIVGPSGKKEISVRAQTPISGVIETPARNLVVSGGWQYMREKVKIFATDASTAQLGEFTDAPPGFDTNIFPPLAGLSKPDSELIFVATDKTVYLFRINVNGS